MRYSFDGGEVESVLLSPHACTGKEWSSTPLKISKLDDELNLDRVIDVPVHQDVLTWDVFELGVVKKIGLCAFFFSCPTKPDTLRCLH